MSNKTINEALKDVFLELGGNPSELSDNQTISDYIEDLGGAIEDAASGAAEDIIDDTEASTSKTYSSNKINSLTAPELPAVTGSDNGKLLGVTEGAWGIVEKENTRTIIEITSGKAFSDNTLTTGIVAERINAGENIFFKYSGMLFTVTAFTVAVSLLAARISAMTLVFDPLDMSTTAYFMDFTGTDSTTCTVTSKSFM